MPHQFYHLSTLGYAYGDFVAHVNHWSMCEKTSGDVVARMALVPRAVEILDIILADEIGHVAIGNRWYGWLCKCDGLDPIAHYEALARRHGAPRLHPPFNQAARRSAGFSDEELARLSGVGE